MRACEGLVTEVTSEGSEKVAAKSSITGAVDMAASPPGAAPPAPAPAAAAVRRFVLRPRPPRRFALLPV